MYSLRTNRPYILCLRSGVMVERKRWRDGKEDGKGWEGMNGRGWEGMGGWEWVGRKEGMGLDGMGRGGKGWDGKGCRSPVRILRNAFFGGCTF